MKFEEFALEEGIQNNLRDLGYVEATPIQEKVLPHAIEGKDISGLAQTGTGKTAAFLLPILQRIVLSRKPTPEGEEPKGFKNWHEKSFALCLVPTRELANQVAEQSIKFSKGLDIHTVCVVGGEDFEKQLSELNKRPLDILIATPGRLIDLYKSNHIDLKQVEAIVFDEADRMFDMGFKDDVKYILRRVPESRQYFLFSATMNLDVLTISYQFGADPVECHLRSEKLKADNVKDEVFHVGQQEKPQYLLSLLRKQEAKQVIIFTNLKRMVLPITDFLQKNSLKAVGISSLLNQKQRNRVLAQFKEENTTNILVATDVAARGLDVEGVDMVINYDLPDDAENYVHRIGRTGRAGKQGVAFSLSSDRDVESLSRIQDYTGHKLEIGWLEDGDLAVDFHPIEIGGYPRVMGDRKRAMDERRNSRNSSRGDSRRPGGRKPREDSKNRKHASGDKYPSQDASVSNSTSASTPTSVSASASKKRRKPRNEQTNTQGNSNKKRVLVSSSKTRNKKKDHRSSASFEKKLPQKQGIGQKITKMFKKLFG